MYSVYFVASIWKEDAASTNTFMFHDSIDFFLILLPNNQNKWDISVVPQELLGPIETTSCHGNRQLRSFMLLPLPPVTGAKGQQKSDHSLADDTFVHSQ